MDFILITLKNIVNVQILSFLGGIFLGFYKPGLAIPKKLSGLIILFILFCIGLKGGGPLAQQLSSSATVFFSLVATLSLWGLVSPFLSFYFLKTYTKLDAATAATVAASFGSVSVMTFVTAISFLDRERVGYNNFVIPILAIMEVPAILSGVFIAHHFGKCKSESKMGVLGILRKCFFNTAILSIALGLLCGYAFHVTGVDSISSSILVAFKPILAIFLIEMGRKVALQREHFRVFSKSLHMFALYTPIVGGLCGLYVSYLFKLDPGTGTLLSVLTASASYIAVPAAMQVVLPEAKQGVYLPLSMGVAFPFNVIIGIPLYYFLACRILT